MIMKEGKPGVVAHIIVVGIVVILGVAFTGMVRVTNANEEARFERTMNAPAHYHDFSSVDFLFSRELDLRVRYLHLANKVIVYQVTHTGVLDRDRRMMVAEEIPIYHMKECDSTNFRYKETDLLSDSVGRLLISAACAAGRSEHARLRKS
jgi:hypothetical protein